MTRASSARPAVNQLATPFVDHVRSLRERNVSIYVAVGHKLGAAASPEIIELLGADLFASNAWLTGSAHHAPLHDAEVLAADAWGADQSFYLVDGSSSGNHAFFLSTLRPGDDVIVSRDLHWSMLVALIMSGAKPHYVVPRMHPELDISLGIAPEDVESALEAHPETRLVAIVSPSYCGVSSNLKGIADIAHARDIPLYVDEAWGAHLHFHPELPASAMESGADAAVSSVHKLLPALSQGSILHVQGTRLNAPRVAQAVRMTQTTTPLFPILASLDAARHQMATQGAELLGPTIDLALDARQRLSRIPGLDVIGAERLGIGRQYHDPSKLLIDVHQWGLTGYEVEQLLNEHYSIAVELSDQRGVLAVLNTGDTSEDIDLLVSAFAGIARDIYPNQPRMIPMRSSGTAIGPAPQVMTPREAYFADSEEVCLADAVGRITADLVTPYPPGIPVLLPGELITAEKAAYLLDLERIGQGTYGALSSLSSKVQVVKDV